MGEPGEAGEVDAWVPDGAAGGIDGAGIVVGVGVGVEGDDLAEKGEAITEVEVAFAVAGIVAIAVATGSDADIGAGGVEAEDVGFEAVEGDGVAYAPEDRPAGKANFEIVA